MKTLFHLENALKSRRNRLLKMIKGECAVFIAAPEKVASHDQSYPYRPDSNFLYLTGIVEPEAALVLRGGGNGPRSVLFVRERDPEREQWTGERLGTRRAKKVCPVDEVLPIEEFENRLPQLLAGFQTVHYAPGIDPIVDELIWLYLRSPIGPRLNFPHTLKDSRLLLNEMRLVKEREEIRILRHVVDLTAHAMLKLFPQLKKTTSELHAAKLLEAHFAELGGSGTAFPTIVASGRNALCLHHSPLLQPLWRNELVLIDAGATFNGYAGDITRTVPVSGRFTGPQATVYDIVLEALNAGIEHSRPGSSLHEVHLAVAKKITEGLVAAKILKGSAQTLFHGGRYKPYFMHRSGHWLGLDVHDVSPVLSKKTTVFESSHVRPFVPGNVFTIEPGLYLPTKDESIPKQYRGIGIRIEDDILITESGCSVLSAAAPKTREEIEAAME
jgi:Xaa-Pro aminopeptidase